MQRHLVVRHEVHTFDDVDLAVCRPVVALRPDTGPYLRAHTECRVSHEIDCVSAEDVRSSRMAGVRRR